MLTAAEVDSLVRAIAPQIAQDPRPRPTLRIGAVGHRAISSDLLPAIEAVIGQLLTDIWQEVTATTAGESGRIHFAGEPQLVLISSLAEGSDRLIAAAALCQGHRLGAILPFSAAAYEKTFDLADPALAIAKFRELLAHASLPGGFGIVALDGDSGPDKRTDAFMEGGRAVVRFSDLVIGIVDADGRNSLTKQALVYATECNIPAVIVDPATLVPTIWTREGDSLPVRDNGEHIREIVRRLMTPTGPSAIGPDSGAESGAVRYVAERVECNFSEEERATVNLFEIRHIEAGWISWSSGLNRLIGRAFRRILGLASAEDGQEKFTDCIDLGLSPATAAPFLTLFLNYIRAASLANEYAELHRSAQIVVTLLSVFAVMFATVTPHSAGWRSALSAAELVCVLIALAIVGKAHQQNWLDRWLAYRLLAECLRYARFLLLTGFPSPFFRADNDRDARRDKQRLWVRDCARFTLRTQTLCVPGCERTPTVEAVEKIKAHVNRFCLADQIAYHQAIASEKRQLAGFFRRLTVVVSVVSVATVALKFGLSLAFPGLLGTGWTQNLLIVAAALLPAITAALLGFRAFGEHDLIANRSVAILPDLIEDRSQIAAAQNLRQLGAGMLRAAETLLAEVDGWLEVFADKHLE